MYTCLANGVRLLDQACAEDGLDWERRFVTVSSLYFPRHVDGRAARLSIEEQGRALSERVFD